MPRIANQDFTLLLDGHRPLDFKAGQDIPVEFEDHWYVVHHTEEVAEEDDKSKTKAKKA